ncbi:MAG: hypothetical protein O7G30_06200 [Proteobacteria bacterium]|nr:hypothetical protein [Pseudomonadota bacterium]
MGSRAWLWGLVPPLLAGAGLRGFRLREQILIGDELHAVNAAVARPVGEIVTQWTYHGADYCVPLAALYRLLLDAGVQLSELGFRAPVLAASLLLVVAVPLALRPRLGRRACLVLAWLLALSPMLVLYGRMVRSYAPAVLLAFAAVVTFDRWWRDRSRGAAAAYAALAAGAVYFHLGAAPLVGAPILYAVLETLVDRRGAPAAERARALLPLAVPLAGLTVLLAALLLPARQSLVELAGLHGDGALPDPATWLDVARLQLGTSAFSLVAVAVGVAARGAWILYRRDARFGLYLLTLAAVHTGWLLLFAPHLFQHLLVVNRYFLLLLPFLLALLALGLASPWTSRPSRVARIAQDAGVAALLAALFATGPLVGDKFRTSPFTHAPTSLTFTAAEDRVDADAPPGFYRELATAATGGEVVLEYPWMNVASHAFDAYQRVHRRPLRVGSLNRLHEDPRLGLRNTLPAHPEDFLESGARYVVVHTDLKAEEARVRTRKFLFAERLIELDELWRVLRAGGARMSVRLEEAWGPPVYVDDAIRVWDLERVRRDAGHATVAPWN